MHLMITKPRKPLENINDLRWKHEKCFCSFSCTFRVLPRNGNSSAQGHMYIFLNRILGMFHHLQYRIRFNLLTEPKRLSIMTIFGPFKRLLIGTDKTRKSRVYDYQCKDIYKTFSKERMPIFLDKKLFVVLSSRANQKTMGISLKKFEENWEVNLVSAKRILN